MEVSRSGGLLTELEGVGEGSVASGITSLFVRFIALNEFCCQDFM
jgi:hypothetical protein